MRYTRTLAAVSKLGKMVNGSKHLQAATLAQASAFAIGFLLAAGVSLMFGVYETTLTHSPFTSRSDLELNQLCLAVSIVLAAIFGVALISSMRRLMRDVRIADQIRRHGSMSA